MSSPNPPKPAKSRRGISSKDRLGNLAHKAVLIGLVTVLLMAGIAALVLAYSMFQPKIVAFLQVATPTFTPAPTPPCIQPTLSLGAYIYPFETIPIAQEDTLPSPIGSAGSAFWLSDTFSPFVFIYEPAIRNLSLQEALVTGDLMVIQWADCGKEEFVLTDMQQGSADIQDVLAQTTPGIVVIAEPVGTSQGYVLYGERPELINPPTPASTNENTLVVDITVGQTVVSDDQQNLLTSLTITNPSHQAIIMTENDLALTVEGMESLKPVSVSPTLPQEIPADGILSLVMVFPNPGGHTAVLRVLDVTADINY